LHIDVSFHSLYYQFDATYKFESNSAACSDGSQS
jgi:hypothetical protein